MFTILLAADAMMMAGGNRQQRHTRHTRYQVDSADVLRQPDYATMSAMICYDDTMLRVTRRCCHGRHTFFATASHDDVRPSQDIDLRLRRYGAMFIHVATRDIAYAACSFTTVERLPLPLRRHAVDMLRLR